MTHKERMRLLDAVAFGILGIAGALLTLLGMAIGYGIVELAQVIGN